MAAHVDLGPGSPSAGKASPCRSPMAASGRKSPAGWRRDAKAPETIATETLSAAAPITQNPDSQLLSPMRPMELQKQSEALNLVLAHIAPIGACLKLRSPTRLEQELRNACGEKYISTASKIRRCKKEPAKRRCVLEQSMASQLVKARALLGDWRKGMRDMKEARRVQDHRKLRELLETWDLSREESEVQLAYADLQRWEETEATFSPQLRKATERRDIGGIRLALKGLNRTGPQNVDGARSARFMLARYHDQENALKQAVASRRSRLLAKAARAWEFEVSHASFVEVRRMLRRHRRITKRLKHYQSKALSSAHSTKKLLELVESWPFAKTAPEWITEPELASARLTLAKAKEINFEDGVWSETEDDHESDDDEAERMDQLRQTAKLLFVQKYAPEEYPVELAESAADLQDLAALVSGSAADAAGGHNSSGIVSASVDDHITYLLGSSTDRCDGAGEEVFSTISSGDLFASPQSSIDQQCDHVLGDITEQALAERLGVTGSSIYSGDLFVSPQSSIDQQCDQILGDITEQALVERFGIHGSFQSGSIAEAQLAPGGASAVQLGIPPYALQKPESTVSSGELYASSQSSMDQHRCHILGDVTDQGGQLEDSQLRDLLGDITGLSGPEGPDSPAHASSAPTHFTNATGIALSDDGGNNIYHQAVAEATDEPKNVSSPKHMRAVPESVQSGYNASKPSSAGTQWTNATENVLSEDLGNDTYHRALASIQDEPRPDGNNGQQVDADHFLAERPLPHMVPEAPCR